MDVGPCRWNLTAPWGNAQRPGYRSPLCKTMSPTFHRGPYQRESEEHMAGTTMTTAHLSLHGAARKAVCTTRWQVLGAGAVAVAMLSAAASPASAAAAGLEPALGVHGEVHLAIWSVNSDGPDFQAILSGAIGDYGPAQTVLPDGKVDPEHTRQMELELRHGTVRLYIDGIVSKFQAQTAHEPIYPATCSDYFSVTANVPLVAGSGTGAYRGIRGDFYSTLSGYEDQKTPPCTGGFLTQILLLTGSGTVSS